MKKGLLFLVLSFITLNIFAQAPQRISYQAVVRDGSGNLLISKSISIRVLISDGASNPIYRETHTNVQTNANGLATIEIGGGTVATGPGLATSLQNINWASATGGYFYTVSIDPTSGTGTNYTIAGLTTRITSVPYALHAANGIPSGGTNGQVLTIVNGVPTWQTPGAGGGSNVTYSTWFSIPAADWKPGGAQTGYTYDYTFIGEQSTQRNASAITQDVLDKGVVLCYAKWILGSTTPVPVVNNTLLPVTTNFPSTGNPIINLNFGLKLGKIDFYFYSNSIDVPTSELAKIQYRYIIIPGNTLVSGRRANGSSYPSASDLKKMTYEEVLKAYDIPE